MNYHLREDFLVDCGFAVAGEHVLRAVEHTNTVLDDFPFSLYRSIDYKTTSSIVGSVFCDALALFTDGIVNPIEKGHPDIIPKEGLGSSEQSLRNYPKGLEVKSTVGNIKQGSALRPGQTRIGHMTGITWQAHHRQTHQLMGLVWDFLSEGKESNYPGITAVFYAPGLQPSDWGEISGTTGRNTKVTGMRASGKDKMGRGWVVLPADGRYLTVYGRLLRIDVKSFRH